VAVLVFDLGDDFTYTPTKEDNFGGSFPLPEFQGLLSKECYKEEATVEGGEEEEEEDAKLISPGVMEVLKRLDIKGYELGLVYKKSDEGLLDKGLLEGKEELERLISWRVAIGEEGNESVM